MYVNVDVRGHLTSTSTLAPTPKLVAELVCIFDSKMRVGVEMPLCIRHAKKFFIRL